MLVTNVSNKSASVSILCVRLTIREMLRWSNLLNPFKKLKSFCKSKLQLSMKSMVKLFCEELKAKGSMTKFDLLEPYPSICMTSRSCCLGSLREEKLCLCRHLKDTTKSVSRFLDRLSAGTRFGQFQPKRDSTRQRFGCSHSHYRNKESNFGHNIL